MRKLGKLGGWRMMQKKREKKENEMGDEEAWEIGGVEDDAVEMSRQCEGEGEILPPSPYWTIFF